MRIFIIGGSGYIGTSTVKVLQERGHLTTALIRDEKQSSQLQSFGAETLLGDLANPENLTTTIQANDALVYTAAGRNKAYAQVEEKVIKHILTVLEGSDKPFVKITGSMVFGDTGPNGFSETAAFNPPPPLAGAAAISETIKVAANRGIKTVQIFPSYVYGHNGGDIPNTMLRVAKQEGMGVYVADGKAMWSTVHVDDVGQLIALAVEKASAGSILFPAASTMMIKEISQDIADAAKLDKAIGLTMEEAQEKLGFFAIPLTLNQVFSDQAASQLGWQPYELSLSESLKHDNRT